MKLRAIHHHVLRLTGAAMLFISAVSARAEGPTDPGLTLTVTSGSTTDVSVTPNAWLYVPASQPATPFVPAGAFTATWEGFITVDLRDSYSFSAELNGAVKAEVNGAVVLDATGSDLTTPASKPVRLNKGTNALKITFTSPAQGDAWLRFFWSSQDFQSEPMPFTALVHDGTAPAVKQSLLVRHGRDLFADHRCFKCHDVTGADKGMLELQMAGPSFDGIGSRRNYEWMTRWILDPKSLRSIAHMPQLLRGAEAKANAESIAAYLASLKGTEAAATDPAADQAAAGKEHFDKLHCVACHNAPDSTEVDPLKISLKQVQSKFVPGTLAAFLQKPEAHFDWIRMPNFRLTAEEAAHLAAFLLANSDKPAAATASTDAAALAKGAKLLQTAGCLSCHGGAPVQNEFKAKPLTELAAAAWTKGCLAETADAAGAAPFFGFKAEDRAALQAFAATDRSSLLRHVPADFAERQTRTLNCAECHGKLDGFPALPIIGAKLKPEWMTSFIGGKVAYKPRPWLETRMPGFGKRAESLAQGLSMMNGLPPHTPPEPPINAEAAEIGRKLVSADGGFSCIACHAIGKFGATQVFESAGLNFAYAGERLQHSYFKRWLLSPQRIDPQTKMPAYFDQGRSPLADYYDGDAAKQIDALWNYMRQGDKMPLPKDATGN